MLNKTFIFLNILILIFFISCQNKSTQLIINDISAEPASEEIEKVLSSREKKPLINMTQDDELIILVREDGAPGMYLGEDGNVYGFYVDLAKMTMEEMEQVYIFEPFSDVGPAAHGLKSGTHHIALAVPDIIDYQSFLNLSIPYEVLQYVTFVNNDNTDIGGNTKDEILESLHGKRVGVQSQGQIHQALREIKEIQFIEYPTTTIALEDLNKGLIDAVPDVKRIGLYYSLNNNWNIKPLGVPIISIKLTTGFSQVYDESLITRYNTALQKIIDDGRLEALYAEYFGPMDEEDKP